MTRKLQLPIIVAGNVNTFEQIDELKRDNIWGFTIGGAVFEKKFVGDGEAEAQIVSVLNQLNK